MNNIILTSSGFSNPGIAKKIDDFFSGDLRDRKVAIITTASEDKEKNEFAVLALSQLREMGFGDVIFFDIEKQDPQELLDYDVVYVNGGNTYYLLYWTKKSGFDIVVKKLLQKGGLYIGVSAGSIIAGPSIEVVNYTKGDPNEIGLTDFFAMNLVQKAIKPHYANESEDTVLAYEKASGVEVVRLADGMALVGEVGERFDLIK